MAIDVLSVGDLIVERLKTQLAALALNTIAPAGTLAGVNDIAQFCPGVFVLPDGATYQTSHYGQAVVIDQTWQTVVIVRNLSKGQSAEAIAGPILGGIIDALSGWSPATTPQTADPMEILSSPPPYYEPGYAEFPLLWSSRMTTVGAG